MSLEPHNVLIAGGAGFIGTNFVRHWLDTTQAGKVVEFDALTYAGRIENLSGQDGNQRYELVRADICDEGAVRAAMARNEIDTVVHFVRSPMWIAPF